MRHMLVSGKQLSSRRKPFNARPARWRPLHTSNPFYKVSDEIQEAVDSHRPVVALETTIYTHGFPYPENVALASRLEAIVRVNGGVPATIGVLDGVARVGLDAEDIIQLVSRADGAAGPMKVSRRDLGYMCGLAVHGRRLNGGTTVAGTMLLAHLAGIKVLATGGLGGVHRGAELSLDVSADLRELGRTALAVVSSGCKSFLCLPRTLEYLETEGVGVLTFADGRTGPVDFPAFWVRDSGFQSPAVVADEAEAAAVIYAQLTLPLASGLLFASPIPRDAALAEADIKRAIDQAVDESYRVGPPNGSRFHGGAHVDNTVVSGSTSGSGHARHIGSAQPAASGSSMPRGAGTVDVLVAGSLAVDVSCDYRPMPGGAAAPQLHTSNPAAIRCSLGGVAHNIAYAAQLLGASVRLCSTVADDLPGRHALAMLRAEGLAADGIHVTKADDESRTAQYVALNDTSRELVMAMADMTILETDPAAAASSFDARWKMAVERAQATWLVLDANWDAASLRRWALAGKAAGSNVMLEPVSAAKATRIFSRSGHLMSPLGVFPRHDIDLATPNALELSSMFHAARDQQHLARADWWQVINALGISDRGARAQFLAATHQHASLVGRGLPQQSIQLLPFMPCIVTKLGRDGVLLTQLLRAGDRRLSSADAAPYVVSRNNAGDGGEVGGVYMRLFPPPPPAEAVVQEDAAAVVSVNGAGDTLVGVMAAGLARSGDMARLDGLIQLAQKGSALTLRTTRSVHPGLGRLRPELDAVLAGPSGDC
ncbi:MAG: hypothetical protein M1826_000458 [Phylliscum demangeonii]|nr:MAG: hypothetical protein M1826_000458 [Phylliscum demangeonii]